MQNNWESAEKLDTDSLLEVVLKVRSNIIDTRKILVYNLCYRLLSYENFKNFCTEDNMIKQWQTGQSHDDKVHSF